MFASFLTFREKKSMARRAHNAILLAPKRPDVIDINGKMRFIHVAQINYIINIGFNIVGLCMSLCRSRKEIHCRSVCSFSDINNAFMSNDW